MTTFTSPFTTDFDRLAETVAATGVGAVEPTIIDTIAADALARGASPVLVGVLVDPTAPPVARIRAFGRVTSVTGRRSMMGVAA